MAKSRITNFCRVVAHPAYLAERPGPQAWGMGPRTPFLLAERPRILSAGFYCSSHLPLRGKTGTLEWGGVSDRKNRGIKEEGEGASDHRRFLPGNRAVSIACVSELEEFHSLEVISGG